MKKYSIFISCFLICFISLFVFTSVKADAVTNGEALSAVKAYESMGGKITSKAVFNEVAEKGGEFIAKKGVTSVGGKFIPVVGEIWTAYDIASSVYGIYQFFLNKLNTPVVVQGSLKYGSNTILFPPAPSANGGPHNNGVYPFLTIPVSAIFPSGLGNSARLTFGFGKFDDINNDVNYGADIEVYEGDYLVFYSYNSSDRYYYVGVADCSTSDLSTSKSSGFFGGAYRVSSSVLNSNHSYTFNVSNFYGGLPSSISSYPTNYTNATYINVPPPTTDISNNFPNGCNYNFPPSIDVNADYNTNIYDTLVSTSTVSTGTVGYTPITKDISTVDNFGNPIDATSGSVTPSNKPKGTSTGFGDFFDSIFKGIWYLLKGILDFFGGLIKLLTDMLISLLVPRDGYFTDFFGGTRDLFNSKLSLNTNIDIFSPTYVNNAGDGGLTSVSYPIFNTYNLTIPFDILNPYLPKIREIMKGLIYPLIVFFNFNNIYKLIRGGSILNAAADSMNSKG